MFPIILDTETTDLDELARIIQLAYKNMDSGEVVNEFFKPPMKISFGAMAVHHVTNEMVADKPSFNGSDEKTKLEALLKDNVLVAHNAPFDMGVLETEGVETPTHIDTLRVARHVLESESYKLQYLRYSLDLKVEGPAHDALGDIQVLEALFALLSEKVKEKFSLSSDEEVLKKMIELSEAPAMLTTFAFGKYNGKTFEEVMETNEGYLKWLYENVTKSPKDKDAELILTLKHHLGITD